MRELPFILILSVFYVELMAQNNFNSLKDSLQKAWVLETGGKIKPYICSKNEGLRLPNDSYRNICNETKSVFKSKQKMVRFIFFLCLI